MKMAVRYDNRKLYCIQKSEYIRLSAVWQAFIAGDPYLIVDSNGVDITAKTLAKIIIAKHQDDEEFFKHVIRFHAPLSR